MVGDFVTALLSVSSTFWCNRKIFWLDAQYCILVKQVFEKEVELVGGELWGSEEFGLKIGFKDNEVNSREFPGLNIHRRVREAGETELRHDAVVV